MKALHRDQPIEDLCNKFFHNFDELIHECSVVGLLSNEPVYVLAGQCTAEPRGHESTLHEEDPILTPYE